MKANKISLAFSVLLLCSTMATMTFASVNNDQVTSQKINEADGTSGQDTNSGSGVKTGHIQDGAVTDAKIAGPISASKISSAGLNADTVDGLHGTDLAPAVHTHPQSQVTGLESSLAGKSDVTHNHDVLYQQKYGKVAVVAQTGGDYTDPISAMNALATWCGAPSATNRCLLKIMPGVYDLGGISLVTQPFVDVEGSGENVTLLKSTSGVINCGDNVEVRLLTGESTGGASYSTAFYINGSAKLTHVTGRASGATLDNVGLSIGGGAPVITNVTIDVLGDRNAKTWGITVDAPGNVVTLNTVRITAENGSFNYASKISSGALEMNNVTAKAIEGPYPFSSRGMWAIGGTVSIRNSYIYGDYAGVSINSPQISVSIQNSTIKGSYSLEYGDSATKVSLSQLDGPFSSSSGLTCFNVYNANFMPITCP